MQKPFIGLEPIGAKLIAPEKLDSGQKDPEHTVPENIVPEQIVPEHIDPKQIIPEQIIPEPIQVSPLKTRRVEIASSGQASDISIAHINTLAISTTVATFDRRAETYQNRFLCLPNYTCTFEKLAQFMTFHQSVLDVACGPGTLAMHLRLACPQLSVVGTDLSTNMLKLAQQNVPEGEFILLDSREIHSLQRQFDVIACAFGLPYLDSEDAAQFIADCAAMLTPKGLMYLSFIECELVPHQQTNSLGDIVWRQGHRGDTIISLLSRHGLTVIWQDSGVTDGETTGFETEHFIIAQKN